MKKWLLTLFVFAAPSLALAVDEGLYEPAPPANSAFVRVIDADAALKTVSATLGGVGFGKVTYPAISPYVVIPAGEKELVAGKLKEKLNLEAGRYYSVALMNGTSKLLEDPSINNPAKARVYFYNLSDAADATLFAPKQKAPILSKQAPGTSTSREMNALTLPLQVLADDKNVKIFPDVALKRRMGTSAVLAGKKGAYRAVIAENKVAR